MTAKYINNIPNIIEELNKDKSKDNQLSIRRLSIDLNINYKNMHNLINRENLGTTQLATLDKIADYLGVSVTDLYIRETE